MTHFLRLWAHVLMCPCGPEGLSPPKMIRTFERDVAVVVWYIALNLSISGRRLTLAVIFISVGFDWLWSRQSWSITYQKLTDTLGLTKLSLRDFVQFRRHSSIKLFFDFMSTEQNSFKIQSLIFVSTFCLDIISSVISSTGALPSACLSLVLPSSHAPDQL